MKSDFPDQNKNNFIDAKIVRAVNLDLLSTDDKIDSLIKERHK